MKTFKIRFEDPWSHSVNLKYHRSRVETLKYRVKSVFSIVLLLLLESFLI